MGSGCTNGNRHAVDNWEKIGTDISDQAPFLLSAADTVLNTVIEVLIDYCIDVLAHIQSGSQPSLRVSSLT